MFVWSNSMRRRSLLHIAKLRLPSRSDVVRYEVEPGMATMGLATSVMMHSHAGNQEGGERLTEAEDRWAADCKASWTRALALVGTQASATSTLRVTSMDSLFSVWYTAVSRFTSLVQPSRLAAMLCTTLSLCLSPVHRSNRTGKLAALLRYLLNS